MRMRAKTLATTILMPACLGLVLAAAACGGGKKGGATTPAGGGGDDESGMSGDPCAEDPCTGGMCPPEVLDAIQQNLLRRRASVARCLSDAVIAGKAEKNSRGSVSLSFIVGTNGRARDVKVVESSIRNPDVERCVIAKVEEIDFGEVPIDLDWSHTYAFESN